MIDLDTLLSQAADPNYKTFHSRLVPGVALRGVRTPALERIARDLAKQYGKQALDTLSPSDYEKTVIYGMLVAYVPLAFNDRLVYLETWLAHNDNWASNDLVCARQTWMRKHKADLVPALNAWMESGDPWKQRFVYTTLLSHYKQSDDLPVIFELLRHPYVCSYYTQMGLAWLLCELLLRTSESIEPWLVQGRFDAFTTQKAFQKAIESKRLPETSRNRYRSLKKQIQPA